jgi:hypothetical protein
MKYPTLLEQIGRRLKCALFGLLLNAAVLAHAQSYALDWWTFDGGGGNSSGGIYSMSGTIGQPDAGVSSGGNYSLSGGFWSIADTGPVPAGPLLKITLAGPHVIVSWPDPSTGFTLQSAPALASPPAAIAWSDVLSPSVVVVSGEKTVTYVAPLDNRYFRLVKP